MAAKVKFDLNKLQLNYFDAASKNAGAANTTIGNMQLALITIIVAELAFDGTTDITNNKPSILGGLAALFLIAAAILFALGSHAQYRHVLKVSRSYFKLSEDVTEFMAKTALTEIDELPDFLSDNNPSLRTNPWANRFFSSAILAILTATILLAIHLFQRIF